MDVVYRWEVGGSNSYSCGWRWHIKLRASRSTRSSDDISSGDGRLRQLSDHIMKALRLNLEGIS